MRPLMTSPSALLFIVLFILLFTVDATTPGVSQPTRIAIVGGGLAGLGTAAQVVVEAGTKLEALHIYDAALPGEGGASAVAAGLLHPFTPRSKEIWQGTKGYAASLALLQKVEAIIGPVSSASGLLRLAMSQDQAGALQDAIADSSGAVAALEQRWLSNEAAQLRAGPAVGGVGALYAEAAITVDVPAYIRGLWALCESQTGPGVTKWCQENVESLSSLLHAPAPTAYDAIVVCLGSRVTGLAGLSALPLTPCRGQNLIFSNDAGLRAPVISGKYLVPVNGATQLLGGATFEYDEAAHAHRPAEASAAEEALLEPLAALYPDVSREQILGCQAGVRALPPRSHFGYVPLAGRLGNSHDTESTSQRLGECWLLGGLGSRGLIHHALLGRAMARAVLCRDDTELPEHTRRRQDALDAVKLS